VQFDEAKKSKQISSQCGVEKAILTGWLETCMDGTLDRAWTGNIPSKANPILEITANLQ
jgi:hypothetical protein